MKRIHQFISILLALCLALGFAGCTNTEPINTDLNEPILSEPGTTGPDATEPTPSASEDPVIPTEPARPDEPTTPEAPTDPPPPTQPSEPDDPTTPEVPTDPPPPTQPVHKHSYSKKVTDPTCTEEGYTTCMCTCGDSYVTDTVTALEHDWSEGILVKEPTELTAGVEEQSCFRCGEIQSILTPNFNRSYLDDTKTLQTGILNYDYDLIPDYMLDSMILRALEFTGYDVQYLKDQRLLFHPDYVGLALSENQTLLREEPILSGIKYSNRGRRGNAYKEAETPEELAASVTGLVPDIAAHQQHGMSCTSFLEYFCCAYLPHCEGIDVSAIKQTHTTAASRYADGTYTYPDLWTEVFEGDGGLVSQGIATHYELSLSDSKNRTAEYNAVWRKLNPGAVIRFRNDTNLYVHYAIYAGTYNNLHYVIHVGNDRGPEILIVEAIGAETSLDPSWPVEFYDLHFEQHDAGVIQIVKSDGETGEKLSGAYFTAVNQATGTKYLIGSTTAEGYTIVEGLPFGTYTVYEATAPDGYILDPTAYTMVLSGDSSLVTLTVTAEKNKSDPNLTEPTGD